LNPANVDTHEATFFINPESRHGVLCTLALLDAQHVALAAQREHARLRRRRREPKTRVWARQHARCANRRAIH